MLKGRLRGLETCLADQQRGIELCDGNGLVLGSAQGPAVTSTSCSRSQKAVDGVWTTG